MAKDKKKAPMKKPPRKNINLNALDNFAAEANASVQDKAIEAQALPTPAKKKVKPTVHGTFPWEREGVNEKVIVPFNLRMSQPNNLKLKYLVKHLPDYTSIHDFCMKTVVERIDQELSKLLK